MCDQAMAFVPFPETTSEQSVADTLAQVIELVKGHIAFPGKAAASGRWSSEDDHLALQMEILGPMPSELLKRGTKTTEYFDAQGRFRTARSEQPIFMTELTMFIASRQSLEDPKDKAHDSDGRHRRQRRALGTTSRHER